MKISKEKKRKERGGGKRIDKRETPLESNEQSNKFTFQH